MIRRHGRPFMAHPVVRSRGYRVLEAVVGIAAIAVLGAVILVMGAPVQ